MNILIYKNKKSIMGEKNDKLSQLRGNIDELEFEMRGLNEQLDLNPSDLLASGDLLDSIQYIQIFDYDQEIQSIKDDSIETLDCLSQLYLSAEDIIMKNLGNIIKNDAEALSDLKFTISCNKRAIISLMKNVDMGISDPLLFTALGAVQKEIRDSIKLSYDLQKKMLTFYKDIRDELSEIKSIEATEVNEYDTVEEIENDTDLHIIDYDKLTLQIDEYKKTKDK